MQIKLYSSSSRGLKIFLSDRKLTFEANDFGEACKLMNGSTSYGYKHICQKTLYVIVIKSNDNNQLLSILL